MSDWADLKHDGDLYSDRDLAYARGTLSKTPSAKRLKTEDREAAQLVVRGMGRTGLTRRPITDAERMTICMLRGKGLSNEEIGEKLKRTPTSISGVISQAQKASESLGLNYDWRADLQEKSVRAIRTALTDGTDVYKGGSLGVSALKGLGVFEQEGAVNVNTLIASVPEHLRSRYVSSDEPPPVITEGAPDGAAG